jgi:aryl-alcohol dehydrogenase-like predicted oxidoreductase
VLGYGATSYESVEQAMALVSECLSHGVNFFDCAEAYSNGEAETSLGEALHRLQVPRCDIVVSTKLFKGGDGPNEVGLSRKHILEGTKASLARLQLDYLDMVLAHRPDDSTPMEEIVRAFNMLLDQNLCLYWGASRWSTRQLTEAWTVANRLGLVGPLVDQGCYSIAGCDDDAVRPWPHAPMPPRGDGRGRVERAMVPLMEDYGMGLSTFSPTAGGLLTGVVEPNSDIPIIKQGETEVFEVAKALEPLAAELGCTVSQLAVAWAVHNTNVATCVFGTSKPSRVAEQVAALALVPKLTGEVMARIEAACGTRPPVPPINEGYQYR